MIKQRLSSEIGRVQGNISCGFLVSVGKNNKLYDFCNMDKKNFMSFATLRLLASCAFVVVVVVLMYLGALHSGSG